MATKTKTLYTDIKKHKIYAIVHEQTLQFFIGVTTSLDMKSVYSQHYSMRNENTRELFKEHRETIYCPQIYVLQTIQCTLSEAKSRQIAFIKLFREHGYTCLNKDYIVEWSEDLSDYSETLYNDIAEKSIENYLSNENHILLNYGRRRGTVNKNKYDEGKKQICIRVSEEEYDIIKKQADKNNMTLTAYVSQVALQGKVLNINYDAIRQHNDEVSKLNNLIKLVVELFAATKEIYDSDIERIIALMKSIDESDKKLLRGFLKHTEKTRNIIKQELRNIS